MDYQNIFDPLQSLPVFVYLYFSVCLWTDFCQHINVTTVQDTVTNLCRHTVEIKMNGSKIAMGQAILCGPDPYSSVIFYPIFPYLFYFVLFYCLFFHLVQECLNRIFSYKCCVSCILLLIVEILFRDSLIQNCADKFFLILR